MAEGVALYIQTVQAAASEEELIDGKAFRWLEKPLDSLEAYHPALGGTCDCAVLKGDRLTVFDFKYGRALVEAKGNPQLYLYAFGVLGWLK
jgi:hypothetical protein